MSLAKKGFAIGMFPAPTSTSAAPAYVATRLERWSLDSMTKLTLAERETRTSLTAAGAPPWRYPGL